MKIQISFALITVLSISTARAERPAGRYVACDRGEQGVEFKTDYSLSEEFFARLRLAPSESRYPAKTGANVVCAKGPPLYREWNGALNTECSFTLTKDLMPAAAKITEPDGTCSEDWAALDKAGDDSVLIFKGKWAEDRLAKISESRLTEKGEYVVKGAVKCAWVRTVIPNKFYRPKQFQCLVKVGPRGEILNW